MTAKVNYFNVTRLKDAFGLCRYSIRFVSPFSTMNGLNNCLERFKFHTFDSYQFQKEFYNMNLIYIVGPSYDNNNIVTRAYIMSHISRINCYTILFLSFFITSLIHTCQPSRIRRDSPAFSSDVPRSREISRCPAFFENGRGTCLRRTPLTPTKIYNYNGRLNDHNRFSIQLMLIW